MFSSLSNIQDCNAYNAGILQRDRLSSDRGLSFEAFRVIAKARSRASMKVSIKILKQV